MNSICGGQLQQRRAKSAMNMTAPLSTPTSRTSRAGVVGGDLLGQLGDLVLDLLLAE